MKFFTRKISSLSDEEILKRYRKDGSKKWVGVLFNRYVHLVFGVCLKYLKDEHRADEATQSLFEKLIAKLRKHEINYFKGWLHAVVRNHCMMILRKSNHQTEELDEVHLQVHDDTEPAELKEVQLQKLEAAITTLKTDQAKCIDMFYLREMSYRQIVDETSYSLKEVKSHIQNGKRNLKIALEKEAGYERKRNIS